jgi:hypothetical protein
MAKRQKSLRIVNGDHQMNKPTISWTAFLFLCLSTFSLGQEASKLSVAPKLEEGFQWLFDGKSWEGWEGNLEYFRIADGTVIAGMLDKKIPHNEFLCTKKTFSDFDLRFDAKLQGQGDNAGVQFRTKRIPNNTEVSGYQCDIGTAWKRSVWGCLYDESRRNKMLAESAPEKLKEWTKQNEWNELRVVAVGPKIEIYLNGHQTVAYTEDDPKIDAEGVIGLQIHSGPPTEALYRNIRIKDLKAQAK